MSRRYQTAAVLAGLPLFVFAQTIQGVDESCVQELTRVAQRCEGTAALKQCWRNRISPECFRQVEAGTGAPDASASCKQELQQAAMPCTEASVAFSKRCVEKNISPNCNDQIRKVEESLKSCQERMQRMLQDCRAEGPDEKKAQKCIERHQAELKSACQRP